MISFPHQSKEASIFTLSFVTFWLYQEQILSFLVHQETLQFHSKSSKPCGLIIMMNWRKYGKTNKELYEKNPTEAPSTKQKYWGEPKYSTFSPSMAWTFHSVFDFPLMKIREHKTSHKRIHITSDKIRIRNQNLLKQFDTTLRPHPKLQRHIAIIIISQDTSIISLTYTKLVLRERIMTISGEKCWNASLITITSMKYFPNQCTKIGRDTQHSSIASAMNSIRTQK